MVENHLIKKVLKNFRDLAGVIINGLSILVLIGILGGLLFVLWREFSKEDEDVSYNYDLGITSNVGEDGRTVPSANTLLGDDEPYQPSKIVPELPPESIMIEAQAPLDTSNGPPLQNLDFQKVGLWNNGNIMANSG